MATFTTRANVEVDYSNQGWVRMGLKFSLLFGILHILLSARYFCNFTFVLNERFLSIFDDIFYHQSNCLYLYFVGSWTAIRDAMFTDRPGIGLMLFVLLQQAILTLEKNEAVHYFHYQCCPDYSNR